MAYYEPKEGSPNKFRLVVSDPAAAGTGKRKRLVRTVEVEDVSLLKDTPRAQQKLELFLNKELAKYEAEVESGEFIKPDRMTLAQFIPQWKKNYANKHMGDYTRKQAMYYIAEQILPFFGHMRLDQIKTIHAVNFMSSRSRKDGSDKPLATNTLMNIYKALKSVLDAAHQWKLINPNPMEGVDRPTANKAEKRTLKKRKKSYTKAEAKLAIEALLKEPDRWFLYFTGVMIGGFRRGEYTAVEWSQMDFERCGIHIDKQWTFDEKGKPKEGELKTEESEAFVPMPHWYMGAMKEFKRTWNKEKLRCPEWKGGNKQYVFHSGAGRPYYPTTPTLTWRRLLKRHGLPAIRLHDLRHTTAMLLRSGRFDTKTIQERLRHTRSTTTENIYMHEDEEISREAADYFEDLQPGRHPLATQDAE